MVRALLQIVFIFFVSHSYVISQFKYKELLFIQWGDQPDQAMLRENISGRVGPTSFFVDDDPYRHNLISPGYHIPVLPSKAIYDRKPDYVIILAPLYADIIMKKNQEYLNQGGTFIKIWPKFEVIS